jgi:hypothetical protein
MLLVLAISLSSHKVCCRKLLLHLLLHKPIALHHSVTSSYCCHVTPHAVKAASWAVASACRVNLLSCSPCASRFLVFWHSYHHCSWWGCVSFVSGLGGWEGSNALICCCIVFFVKGLASVHGFARRQGCACISCHFGNCSSRASRVCDKPGSGCDDVLYCHLPCQPVSHGSMIRKASRSTQWFRRNYTYRP